MVGKQQLGHYLQSLSYPSIEALVVKTPAQALNIRVQALNTGAAGLNILDPANHW